MKKIFEKIWNLALPYQDKRDDKGHAEITLKYAIKLLNSVGGDENVVVPAIILHDIGWSKLTNRERTLLVDENRTREQELFIRLKHQKEGVRLAEQILNEVYYPLKLIKDILEIISEHDTRVGFISQSEGLVRDADKLWRFSAVGISSDLRRFKIQFSEIYDKLKNHRIDKKHYFYSEEAKQLALRELEERKKEYAKFPLHK